MKFLSEINKAGMKFDFPFEGTDTIFRLVRAGQIDQMEYGTAYDEAIRGRTETGRNRSVAALEAMKEHVLKHCAEVVNWAEDQPSITDKGEMAKVLGGLYLMQLIRMVAAINYGLDESKTPEGRKEAELEKIEAKNG